MHDRTVRQQLISVCRRMKTAGLNQGSSGNASARQGCWMLITPSGIPCEELQPEHIARMQLDDDSDAWEGPFKPSSEWRFHRTILQDRPLTQAIVHTHSTFATVLSIARISIPACHYMIALFGGNSVRCASYATFGTAELSANVIDAMRDRNACLLSNHGMIASGESLDKALAAALELEALCKQYYHARLLGEVSVLSDSEMQRVLDKFRHYGPGHWRA